MSNSIQQRSTCLCRKANCLGRAVNLIVKGKLVILLNIIILSSKFDEVGALVLSKRLLSAGNVTAAPEPECPHPKSSTNPRLSKELITFAKSVVEPDEFDDAELDELILMHNKLCKEKGEKRIFVIRRF